MSLLPLKWFIYTLVNKSGKESSRELKLDWLNKNQETAQDPWSKCTFSHESIWFLKWRPCCQPVHSRVNTNKNKANTMNCRLKEAAPQKPTTLIGQMWVNCLSGMASQCNLCALSLGLQWPKATSRWSKLNELYQVDFLKLLLSKETISLTVSTGASDEKPR